MNYKAKLKHDLSLLNMIMIIAGLVAIIACIVLRFTIGYDNIWTHATLCVALICVFEASYSSGYLKGLSYTDKGE